MANIAADFKDSDYSWNEVGGNTGGGNRAMKISGAGLGKNGTQFDISPNPHDNPAYNKDQKALYNGFAGVIESGWPKRGKASFKTVASFDDIPKEGKPKNASKLSLDRQKKALKAYNEDGLKKAEASVQAAYESAVKTHIDGKKGKSFTLGGVSYSLT